MTIAPFPLFEKLCRNLLPQRWIYAKTMPENPHWYTLRREWGNDNDFIEAVNFIREYGYTEIFRRKAYIMLNINEYKYWTMGAPINDTILINRRYHNLECDYDRVADIYDNLFNDAESLAENQEIMSMLPPALNVLDIGCGSGLYLNYNNPPGYLGIDPSRKMLEVLSNKHLAYSAMTIRTRFEDFIGAHYDLVISLFGAANYIQPAALNRIPEMVIPGGSYFIMFYKPGYSPVCYERAGVKFNYFQYNPNNLPGEIIEYHNFIIVKGRV